MRKGRLSVLLILSVCLVIPAFSQSGRTAVVSVRETHLRPNQSFFGEPIETLGYETEVEVLAPPRSGDAWVRARTKCGKEGWIHRSALETRRFVFRSGDQDARHSADTDEVALAARGFNEEVEREYRSQQAIDYSGVDHMQGIEVSSEELIEFMREGGLSLPGGSTR